MQQALDLDGHCNGPLFAPVRKIRLPTRPKGKEGVVHRAQTVRATPVWSEREAIRRLYAEARRKTRNTGVLHVLANLRVTTAVENTTKANLWWPDMPEFQTELEI